jgi:hypothetical protein
MDRSGRRLPAHVLRRPKRRITDNPAYATFPNPINQKGIPTEIAYTEGLYVGYRGYEKRDIKPLYAFGYGLSYTEFGFSNLKINPSAQNDNNSLTKVNLSEGKPEVDNENHDLADVSFTVTNTGKRAGAEVAQLYVGQENPTIDRPIKELKGFKRVYLQPGESETVTLPLNLRSLLTGTKRPRNGLLCQEPIRCRSVLRPMTSRLKVSSLSRTSLPPIPDLSPQSNSKSRLFRY